MSTIGQTMPQAMPFFATDFGSVAASLRRATVMITGRRGGSGSGVIWDRNGLVITNSHVVGENTSQVLLDDGRTVKAVLVKRDPEHDLAALQLEASDLSTATIGDSRSLRPGELVLAVGNPMGEVGAVSAGIVYAIHEDWIQADVRLAPGNSGGPLADANGEVIGINSMIAGGLAVAVPAQVVKDFLQSEAGEPVRLGFTIRPVVARVKGGEVLGLMVLELTSGGAAEAGGLLIGDTLLSVDGRFFLRPTGFVKTMQRTFAEDGLLKLDVLRGGKRIVVTVTNEDRKSRTEDE
jgi:serine protease Do